MTIHYKVTDDNFEFHYGDPLSLIGEGFMVEVTDVNPLDDGDLEITLNLIDRL